MVKVRYTFQNWSRQTFYCHFYCIFSRKRVYHTFTTLLPQKRFTTVNFERFTTPLPRSYHGKVYHNLYCHIFGWEKSLYHKVSHRMLAHILDNKSKALIPSWQLGGVVDSVVLWTRFNCTPFPCECSLSLGKAVHWIYDICSICKCKYKEKIAK